LESNQRNYKLFIIAGERSGDLHGSNLIYALRKKNPNIEIKAWGGGLMQSAGAEISMHYSKLAFMGFWEVFKNLFTIAKYLKQCKSEIQDFKPHAIVLIDYAGFNLKIAKFASQNKLKVFYYIPPKVWAWNASRANKLRESVHQVFAILPFEVPFFQSYGVNVQYVGNPLIDAINAYKPNHTFIDRYKSNTTIAILPGSRYQEVFHMINELSILVDTLPDYKFLVAGVDNLDKSLYDPISTKPNVELFFDSTYDILSASRAAIVTSGTATLETALFNIPQLVCYKTSVVTYAIAKRVINIKYISLVNLIADKSVVPELIQADFSSSILLQNLQNIVEETDDRTSQLVGYAEVKEKVTQVSASDATAEAILLDLGRS
jgi:lipid-A-disaccharide synthase